MLQPMGSMVFIIPSDIIKSSSIINAVDPLALACNLYYLKLPRATDHKRPNRRVHGVCDHRYAQQQKPKLHDLDAWKRVTWLIRVLQPRCVQIMTYMVYIPRNPYRLENTAYCIGYGGNVNWQDRD